MPSPPSISLPGQWPEHVKSGILHAISLAGVALPGTYYSGRITESEMAPLLVQWNSMLPEAR